METIRAQVTEEKAKQYRKVAMQIFGYSKGSISKAVEKAMDELVKKFEVKQREEKPDWSKLKGILKHVNMTSVELQHKAKDYWIESVS